MTEPTPTHAYMTRQKKRGSGNLGTFKQILQLVCFKLECSYVSLSLFSFSLSSYFFFHEKRSLLHPLLSPHLLSCLVAPRHAGLKMCGNGKAK